MITKEDTDRPGTIHHGEMEIIGQVLKVNDDDTFTFATAQFGSIRLDINQWAFKPPVFEGLAPGWYDSTEFPASFHVGPFYVDSEGVAHSFFIHKGLPSSVQYPLRQYAAIAATLRPLQTQQA